MSYLPSNYDYFDIPRHMERKRLEAYDALLGRNKELIAALRAINSANIAYQHAAFNRDLLGCASAETAQLAAQEKAGALLATIALTDPDGPTPPLTCDYAHLAHSGGGTNHGPATHDLRGYRICDKCYDAIIAAEQCEAGYYHEKKDSP